MENLRYYEKLRQVPNEAKKQIAAGRLKGMTDINPMWRIKKLTETFGPCGIGWYPEIIDTWLDHGANGEISANMKILLYVKEGENWSKGIPGIGGSKFVAKETAGLYTDDEAYKKAFTDAISVAAKLLGVAADVYFEKDSTKYDGNNSVHTKSSDTAPKTSGDGNHSEELKNSPQAAKAALRKAWTREILVGEKQVRLGDLSAETLKKYSEKTKDKTLRDDMLRVMQHKFTEAAKAETTDLPFKDVGSGNAEG